MRVPLSRSVCFRSVCFRSLFSTSVSPVSPLSPSNDSSVSPSSVPLSSESPSTMSSVPLSSTVSSESPSTDSPVSDSGLGKVDSKVLELYLLTQVVRGAGAEQEALVRSVMASVAKGKDQAVLAKIITDAINKGGQDTLLKAVVEVMNKDGLENKEQYDKLLAVWENLMRQQNFYYRVSWIWTGGLIFFVLLQLTFLALKPEWSIFSGIFKDKEFLPVTSTTRFYNVIGCDEAKAELIEIVEYLKNPERFQRLGGKISKGVLLKGPPGTGLISIFFLLNLGKTLLARAVAGEAGCNFLYASGSEFEEMFVGVGSKRIRALFAQAKKNAPCIVFIDEIDTLGINRKATDNGVQRATLNQLLTEMDGFLEKENIIVMAATNTEKVLDPALLRSGRFDKHISVPLPDLEGRNQIIKHYLKNVIHDPTIDSLTIARGTPGCSGADLHNIVNMAARKAAAERKFAVAMSDLEFSKDRLLMGAERLSAVPSAETLKAIAFHEGGHALVATLTPHANPIHLATIIRRGDALGLVYQLPKDELSVSKRELLAQIDVAMGGRAAEEVIYGEDCVGAGAGSDIAQATKRATQMVVNLGMSKEIGLVYHSEEDVARLSPNMKEKIDDEVKAILDNSYNRVKKLIISNKHKLERLANALIEYKTLNGDEVKNALEGEPIIRAEPLLIEPEEILPIMPSLPIRSDKPLRAPTRL